MKLMIVDDDALVTSGLKTIIEMGSKELDDPIKIIAVGHDGQEAINLYNNNEIDIILMDIRMPVMNGLEAGKELLQLDPQVKIIYLTTFQEDEYIIEALRIGSKGYLLKTDYQSLIPAIRAVNNGHRVFGDEIIAKLPQFIDSSPHRSTLDPLTNTENQLVHWLAQGLSNKEIAEKMHFSQGTIRNYLSVILEKLNLRDRTQLVIYYYKHLSE
ncbi:response regulator transcription factor [Facklamia miroungae]|uniref:DNA-binding response regulator, NarL/FixJ family, contains REC and HTH domains n=1 Tax=Facklamia miroungae TaxID=120956 RepID=A0A1G7QSM7_9LACT|nr:response regulator transcription factor [Facklamia miroungae]NKZ29049.1 response regulator transcription factor [Facklamia miroungae]SDG01493.1 DNA-binding response regulator, NarL/FixJ family, contains REC and HTH domains [Facklamia miroungae]